MRATRRPFAGVQVMHERVLCALHNLIRAHQLLAGSSTQCMAAAALPPRQSQGPSCSGGIEGSPCSTTKGSASHAACSGGDDGGACHSSSTSHTHSAVVTAARPGRLPADLHKGPASPRYGELLRLPQVQVALQRQLRRPPLQGGTAGSSNCRYLAAKVRA